MVNETNWLLYIYRERDRGRERERERSNEFKKHIPLMNNVMVL